VSSADGIEKEQAGVSDSGRVGRQLSLVTLDQAISSASNVLFLALAAHALSLGSFGLFNIVFGSYVLVQCVGRALVSDPLLIHPLEAESRPGVVVGASLVAGAGLGALVGASGVVLVLFHSGLGWAMIALGVLLPLLLVQDVGRFIAFAARNPIHAVWLDSIWLVLALVGAVVLIAMHEDSLALFVAVWAGTGGLAGLLVFVWAKQPARPSRTWIVENWHYSSRYLVGYVASQGSGLLVTIIGGLIVGARGLGALRAANLLSRPFGTFQIAAAATAVTHVARYGEERAAARASIKRTTYLVVLVAAIMSAILLALPDSIGRMAIGDAWHAAHPLLIPVCGAMFCVALQTPARAGLLGLKYVGLATRVDVFSAVSSLVGSIGGVLVAGVEGGMWAIVIFGGISAAVWWVVLLAKLRTHWAPAPKHAAVSA